MAGFNPSIVVDGHSVEVPGILWIFAFALRGVPWAVEEMRKPEVEAQLKAYLLKQKMHNRQKTIDYLSTRLNHQMKEQLEDLCRLVSLKP